MFRFWANGWIEKLYIAPKFHFSYYGFDWVQPLGVYTYFLFILCGISALAIAVGFKYRWAVLVFFLSFTYIELIDKTTYLNHYYFISVLSFLLFFLPANRYFSWDAKQKKMDSFYVPQWTVDSIKMLISLVYFYAGLAKLNSDWLVKAMPLKIWLPSKYDIPLIGNLMGQEWVHYAFSWGGLGYDLLIPFLLLYKRTRWIGFILVVVFHVLTRVLFPIGIFPFIMIVSAFIFFDAKIHRKILAFISKVCLLESKIFKISKTAVGNKIKANTTFVIKPLNAYVVAGFILIQLLFPWRYLLYPNELFWTEEGYRFSWRVMLMEKAGYAQFTVKDGITGKKFAVNNSDFLTSFQEKQMSVQPDFILEYAHYLGEYFTAQGHQNLEVYVESYIALNGRLSQPYIDPKVNLLAEEDSFLPKSFLLPFNDTIKGL